MIGMWLDLLRGLVFSYSNQSQQVGAKSAGVMCSNQGNRTSTAQSDRSDEFHCGFHSAGSTSYAPFQLYLLAHWRPSLGLLSDLILVKSSLIDHCQ